MKKHSSLRISALSYSLIALLALSFIPSLQATPKLKKNATISKIYLFDIDNVVIERDKAGFRNALIKYIVWDAPHKLSLMKFGMQKIWQKLRKSEEKKIEPKIAAAPSPDGTSYTIASHLKSFPHGKDYFEDISRLVNGKRRYVTGMAELLTDLGKDPQALLVAVTNKDHYAFNQTSQALTPHLSDLFHIVITADHISLEDSLFTIPAESKNTTFDDKTLYFHSQVPKPNGEYFTRTFEILNDFAKNNELTIDSKAMVTFIDDTKENIDGFNSFKLDATGPFKNKQSILFNRSLKELQSLKDKAIFKESPAFETAINLKSRYDRIGGSLLRIWDRLRKR